MIATVLSNSYPCRHYEGDVLSLLEVSLDMNLSHMNLSHNALKLVLRGEGPVLPDVGAQEVGSAHVMVLFATTFTAMAFTCFRSS